MANDVHSADHVSVEVIEDYQDWRPPIDVKTHVEKMLASVPRKYLGNLGRVVLTNTAAFNHDARRRKVRQSGQTYPWKERLGSYHATHKGSPAWIELVVDNMLKNYQGIKLRFPVTRDHAIGSTLFHELGHHIHKNFAPEYGDKEETAESWRAKLEMDYMKQQVGQRPLLLSILKRFGPLLKGLAQGVNKIALRSDGYRKLAAREDARLRRRSKR